MVNMLKEQSTETQVREDWQKEENSPNLQMYTEEIQAIFLF